MIESTTKLNTPGTKLGSLAGVHALTDVTGFGLLGHLLEICKGSGVASHVEWDKLPLLPGALDLARQGFTTGASKRNFAGYGEMVSLGAGIDDAGRAILTDPQTSGGLLVSCSAGAVDEVLGIFAAGGFGRATVIGEIVTGEPAVRVD
jgi:selenide,water dikinase